MPEIKIGVVAVSRDCFPESLLVIEHNLDVIKTADYIIDMGPEGGRNGGVVLMTGTPEEIASHADVGYTARYLKAELGI